MMGQYADATSAINAAPAALAVNAGVRQIYVPVRAIGNTVLDNGGDAIAVCPNSVIAQGIAAAINRDAGR